MARGHGVRAPDGELFGVSGPLGSAVGHSIRLMYADGSGFEYLIDDSTAHENHFSWGPRTPD